MVTRKERKKEKMKKTSLTLIAVALAMITACGSTTKKDTSDVAEQVTTAATAEQAEEHAVYNREDLIGVIPEIVLAPGEDPVPLGVKVPDSVMSRIEGPKPLFLYSHPEYWDEIFKTYAGSAYTGKAPANPMEQAFVDNGIGEYGVCIDDIGEGKFRYLIAGKYTGGAVPEGMVVYEFPRSDWAVFSCVGPNPDTLQRVNTQIYREWLPGHPEFELCGCATVEWYDCINGVMTDPDYHSAIWLPIRKKTALNDNG